MTKTESFKAESRPTGEVWRQWKQRFQAWCRSEWKEAQLSYIQFRAEKGDPAKEFRLGLAYESGEYGPRCDRQAYKWYLRAAFQGMAEAQAKISEFYHTGRGVARNEEEAFIWCRKAAEQGHHACQLRLAQRYRDGVGVERNPMEAKKWFGKAGRSLD